MVKMLKYYLSSIALRALGRRGNVLLAVDSSTRKRPRVLLTVGEIFRFGSERPSPPRETGGRGACARKPISAVWSRIVRTGSCMRLGEYPPRLTVYWYNPRFLNWGPGPSCMVKECTNTCSIRGRYVPYPYCALSRVCLADPVHTENTTHTHTQTHTHIQMPEIRHE
jgi:hypothetical protein